MAGTARGAAAIKLREVVSRLLARPEEPNPAFERRQGQGPYRGHHRRDPDQPDREPNILFGNLQKITSEQLGLSPVLMAAANSSGGVMGKMIDAQSIVVASTATNWYGHESTILRFVFKHSIALACLVALLVMLQAYVYPFTEMILK